MITKAQRSQLSAIVRRLVNAEVADAWKGAGDPVDVAEIELELERARNAWARLLDRLEKPAKGGEEHAKRYEVFRQALLENEVWAYELVEKAMTQFHSDEQFDSQVDLNRAKVKK